MATKILNTRIILRNDSTVNWNASVTEILSKGEVGIEFLTNGKAKIKIGNGTNTWDQLKYFGSEETQIFELNATNEEVDDTLIATATKNHELHPGDISIIKRLINENTPSYTAYVYNGSNWAAMDGNYNAKNIYFDQNLLTTSAIGNISLSNGQATIESNGKNLLDVWEKIFVKEDTNISKTLPTVSVSGDSLKYLEIGSSASQTLTLSYEDGRYEYGYSNDEGPIKEGAPSQTLPVNNGTTGAKANTYKVIYETTEVPETTGHKFVVNSGVQTKKASTSAIPQILYSDGKYPVSNLKKVYPSKRIVAGSTSHEKIELFRWYIPMYYGFKSSGLLPNPAKITNDQVKALGTVIRDENAYNGTKPTYVSTSSNWQQFFIAIPSSYTSKVPSITDKNGLPLTVEVANDVSISYNGTTVNYHVWFVNLSAPYKTLSMTIKW